MNFFSWILSRGRSAVNPAHRRSRCGDPGFRCGHSLHWPQWSIREKQTFEGGGETRWRGWCTDSRPHHHFVKDMQMSQKERLFKRDKEPSGDLGLTGQIIGCQNQYFFFFFWEDSEPSVRAATGKRFLKRRYLIGSRSRVSLSYLPLSRFLST